MVAKLKIFIENDKKTCAIYSISHSNLYHISFQLDANHAVIYVRLHCNLPQVTRLSASEYEMDRMRMAGEATWEGMPFPCKWMKRE